MGSIGKLASLVHNLFCGFTLLTYALCFWPVVSHWLVGFMTMSLPVLVLIHVILLFLLNLVGARGMMLKSFFVLLLSFPFWSRTFQSGNAGNEASGAFRVLSYNVHQFGVMSKPGGEKSLLTDQGIAWLKEKDADLLCFQETYHLTNSATDPVSVMKKLGYRHFVFLGGKINEKPRAGTGLAFFSKNKLINMQKVAFEGQNGLLKVDVVTEKDTVTVINVHFQSMTLNLDELSEQRKMDGIKSESKKTFARMKHGFLRRNEQIQKLEELVNDSRHPVIVCGDFNETPYSYPYGRLSRVLRNSFEEGGSGFGFTFRNLPYFIRIDHQFYDANKIGLVDFFTDREANFSDHRPIIAGYDLGADIEPKED